MCGVLAGIMCGILATTGDISKDDIINMNDILILGVDNLLYRGNDSAGVASVINNEFVIKKSLYDTTTPKPSLINHINIPNHSTNFVAHVRWATNGAPTTENAHPIIVNNVAVVHNGIVTNVKKLKRELKNSFTFKSNTDTEVIGVLLHNALLECGEDNNKILKKTNSVVKKIEGNNSIVFMLKNMPNYLYGYKNGGSLLVGLSKNSCFITSDKSALPKTVNELIMLEDGHMVSIDNKCEIFIYNKDMDRIKPTPQKFNFEESSLTYAPFDSFYEKELNQLPEVCKKSVISANAIDQLRRIDLSVIKKIVILGCGSSYNAGLVGKFFLEKYANVTTDVVHASEYNYNKKIDEETLFIAVSQSGETLDVLTAIEQLNNLPLITVSNTEHSALLRKGTYNIYINMLGAEKSVAATKSFITQVLFFKHLSYLLGNVNIIDDSIVDVSSALNICKEHFDKFIKNPPNLFTTSVKSLIKQTPFISKFINYIGYEQKFNTSSEIDLHHFLHNATNIVLIAKGVLYPIAKEGALKITELSATPTKDVLAGEIKHGYLSGVNDRVLYIALIQCEDKNYKSLIKDLRILKTKNGQILSIFDNSNDISKINEIKELSRWSIQLPKTSFTIAPILFAIPLQYLAYYIAKLKGKNIDNPKNMAKSITV